MSRRQHFDSGHNKPEHSFELLDKGDEYAGSERYKMLMHTSDYEGMPVASVTYDTYENEYTRPTLEVSYLKSHLEGKGHAKALMQHIYDQYPKHYIDWGHTISPASTHLAQQFEDKYYNRTGYYSDYYSDDDDTD